MSKKKKIVKARSVKHEIILRVKSDPTNSVSERDLLPEVSDGGKYMIPKTWMSERQVLKMVQQTPPQHIYTRPAKGGGTWSYITQSYVVKVLNFVFGWNWDFEIVDKGQEGGQVWVQGKLTVKSPKGEQIIKTQFGRADIKYKKDTKIMLDYGNDLKAASSDALKKCASLIGIGSDIYGKAEMKHDAGKDVTNRELPALPPVSNQKPSQGANRAIKEGQVMGPDGVPVYLCSVGQEIISEAEYIYSKKMFKKALCRAHQKYGK
jgi:hypothetical protein